MCINTKNGKNVFWKLHKFIKPKEDLSILFKALLCPQYPAITANGADWSVAARNSNKSQKAASFNIPPPATRDDKDLL